MARRVRDDDHRSDELLSEHGRIAFRLGLAIGWTSGIRGDSAKRAADSGSGAWKRAAPLPEEQWAAGLFAERCRTRNPVVTAVASNLVLVEVDGEDDLLAPLDIGLPPTVTARSRRGLHRYYRPDEDCAPGKIQIDDDGVVYSEDGYLCLPPSLHVSGQVYAYVRDGSIATLPADTYRRIRALAEATEERVEEIARDGGKVPEGHRDRFIFLKALEMAHSGLDEAAILAAALVLGRDHCEPPLREELVQRQVKGAIRRAKKKPAANRELRVEVEKTLLTALEPTPAPAVHATTTSRPGVVTARSKVTIVGADAIREQRQEWLVRGQVPLRTMTLVAGVGGLGKSTWTLQLVSRLTRGELSCEGGALILSYEDGAEDVIVPRLKAADADLSKVGILRKEGGILTLPGDFPELVGCLLERQARLLIIDPISAALSLKLGAHRDQDVRVVLGELDRVTKELGLASVLIAHLNKAPSQDAYVRVNGSTAFYNACRSVITVTLDPDDPDCRFIAQHKANYSRLVPVERHRIEEHSYWSDEGDFISTSRMAFVEEAEDVNPYDVLAAVVSRPPTKRDEAKTLLVAMLADREWHERERVEEVITARGIGRDTLERAAKEMGIESERHGVPPRARWRLPIAATPSTDGLRQLNETA